MPRTGLVLILAALVVGVADWVAIATGRKRAGYVLKPATLAVITAMVVSAVATAGRAEWTVGSGAFTIGGALLFYGSDAMIGWTRFVAEFPRSRVLITATYHLGQAGLVLGLLG